MRFSKQDSPDINDNNNDILGYTYRTVKYFNFRFSGYLDGKVEGGAPILMMLFRSPTIFSQVIKPDGSTPSGYNIAWKIPVCSVNYRPPFVALRVSQVVTFMKLENFL